jgi:hypothetical protein
VASCSASGFEIENGGVLEKPSGVSPKMMPLDLPP